MKFAYLIYFPYLCANNMQEQTVIYLFKNFQMPSGFKLSENCHHVADFDTIK